MGNPIVPCQNERKLLEYRGFSSEFLVVHLHFRVYRACCDQLDNLALLALRSIAFCLQQTRKIGVVDYCYTSTLRGVNAIFKQVFEEDLIAAETCKTLKQKWREREVVLFRRTLGNDSVSTRFSQHTASFLSEVIPNVVAEKLDAVPPFAEGWLLYRLGITVRYINYQLKKKTGYRDALISSAFAKRVQANYCKIRTRLAHSLLSKHNLDPLVSFEYLLLQLLVKLKTPSEGNRLERCSATAVSSLAASFSQQGKIDRFLEDLPLKSEEEALIARLEWHKRDGSLPKGVPDPVKERLTTSNLYEKFDEAANKYLEGIIENLVDRFAPPSLKRGFSGAVYFLEGRDAAIEVLTMLTTQLAVKQLSDPHLFALAILFATNQDVTDFELDGFGRGNKAELLDTGREMMKAMLKEMRSSQATLSIFEDSGLRSNRGGLEEIRQKCETKKALRQYIATVLHDLIKEENFRHSDGMLRAVRRKTKRIPLVSSATISLHVLINGVFFSLGYPLRDAKQGETSFLSYMFKHMSGMGLCNFLAGRIVDLIYHPSWRITLMQVLEKIWETFLDESSENQPLSRENFNHITEFLAGHFFRDHEYLFGGNTSQIFDFFAGDAVFEEFQRFLQPAEESNLEKGLEVLLPTMKELLLSCRIVDGFRKEGISFEGDAKFWEVFLRESLTQLAEREFSEKQPTPAELVAMREKFLDGLLLFSPLQLYAYFVRFPEFSSTLQGWVSVSSDEPAVHMNSQGTLNGLIRWDYEPNNNG